MDTLTQKLLEKVQNLPEVNKFRLSGPDGLRTDYYGLFTDKGENIGPAVRKGYIPHTTENDVVPMAIAGVKAFDENDLDNSDQCRVNVKFKQGHIISIRPGKSWERSVAGSDTIFPLLNIHAVYGQTFRVKFGMYRQQCTNMAELRGVSGNIDLRLRHTSGIKHHIQETIATMREAVNGWDAMVDYCKKLKEIKVNTEEFLKKLYPEDSINSLAAKTRHEARTRDIIERIQREAHQLGEPTDILTEVDGWLLLNGVQGYCQHDKSRRGGEDMGHFDRAVAAFGDADVVKAERLILSLGV